MFSDAHFHFHHKRDPNSQNTFGKQQKWFICNKLLKVKNIGRLSLDNMISKGNGNIDDIIAVGSALQHLKKTKKNLLVLKSELEFWITVDYLFNSIWEIKTDLLVMLWLKISYRFSHWLWPVKYISQCTWSFLYSRIVSMTPCALWGGTLHSPTYSGFTRLSAANLI